jgi:hypothetical protein
VVCHASRPLVSAACSATVSSDVMGRFPSAGVTFFTA